MIQPEYINLNNWAASLLVDYNQDNIPLLYDEKKWEIWAVDLINTAPFRGRSIPTPDTIKEDREIKYNQNEKWRKWARIVYFIMNQG